MSLEQQARKELRERIRKAKSMLPASPYDAVFSLPGSHDTSKRVYDKPTQTQAEARAHRLKIELMEEEKLLNEMIGEVI